ncbi:MAG: hypothetical protein IIA70_07985, partial [Proteobacteria bacterium]|nr:hypothetical protein [Pseudomonadota bacterium]
LHIGLMREVPEHKRPRNIPITTGTAGPVLEGVKSKVEKSKKSKQAA